MKQSLILILSTCFAVLQATAQTVADSSLAKAETLVREVQEALSAKPVSFQVKYLYANESTPNVLLDSVFGSIDMDGARYRCLLENTETICNGRYNIVLFRDDKVMYLTKAGADSVAADPVSAVMMAFRSAGAQNCDVVNMGQDRLLRIRFKDGGPYREIEIVVEFASRRLKSVGYIVRTQELMEGNETVPEGYDRYARVNAEFYNYRYKKPAAGSYDEDRFFTKEGRQFKPTQAYKDYTIFIGTPHLYQDL